MQEQTLSAHEARQQWRLVTTSAIAGKITIVTHYGDELGAFVPIEEYRQMKAALAQQRSEPVSQRGSDSAGDGRAAGKRQLA